MGHLYTPSLNFASAFDDTVIQRALNAALFFVKLFLMVARMNLALLLNMTFSQLQRKILTSLLAERYF